MSFFEVEETIWPMFAQESLKAIDALFFLGNLPSKMSV